MNTQNQARLTEIKKVLKVPSETEFLSLCSSFSQYTGKKIRINFLDKPIEANKFITVIYDVYFMNFVNPDEMAERMSGFMYADLKEKIQASNVQRSE